MRVDILATALARTADVRDASWAVVEHLETPELRPSVYMERGGRLRCQALSGYRQLLDGMPPWAGVIGRTYATGEESVVMDVGLDENYLPVSDGVRAEVCFPLACRGRTVGALNVESSRPLRPEEVEHIRVCAQALSAKLLALGGPPPESASQRLVRHAIALATQYDVAAIERAVIAAAADVTPLASAMLLRRSSRSEPFRCVHVHGSLGPALSRTPARAIASLAAFTNAGCSVYTVAGVRPGAADGAATAALRTAGATSMAVLAVGGDRILVCGDESSTNLTTEQCELLELLAAQASACLRTAASVIELRAQAATDSLTGLGHHATFHTELAEARASGDVGVLVVDIDGFKSYNDRHGHPAGDRALRSIAAALTEALRRGDALFRIGGDEFAALLPGVDGATALEVAHRLHSAAAFSECGLSVSIGAAAAQPGENEVAILARADRALYAVKGGGRDGVALDGGAEPG